MMESLLLDKMEEFMKLYYESEKYQITRKTINTEISGLRSQLPEDLHSRFNRLINMISNADTRLCEEAFRGWVVQED